METYSDEALTTNAVDFAPGDTVYIGGSVTSLEATTDTAIAVKVYNSSDEQQSTPLDTTYSFTANTAATLTTINSATVLTWVTTSNTAIGDYYLELTVGDEVLTIWFELSGAPSSISYTTTADFDTGTYTLALAESDNLYGGLYEDFADDSLNAAFVSVNPVGGTQWSYSGGTAVLGALETGLLLGASYIAMSQFGTYKSVATLSNNKYNFIMLDKATQPTLVAPGSSVLAVYGESSGTVSLSMARRLADNSIQYWNGTAWGSSGSVSLSADAPYTTTVSRSGNVITMKVLDNSGDTITTATTDIDILYSDSGNMWVGTGGTVATSGEEYTLYEFGIGLLSGSTWTTPSITPPTDKKLKSLTFTLSNGSEGVNYIDKVEILDSSDDSVIDTASGNIHATDTIIWTDFDNHLNPTFNTPFKIKVYFVNSGTAILTVSAIAGTYETLALLRTDGETWV